MLKCASEAVKGVGANDDFILCNLNSGQEGMVARSLPAICIVFLSFTSFVLVWLSNITMLTWPGHHFTLDFVSFS